MDKIIFQLHKKGDYYDIYNEQAKMVADALNLPLLKKYVKTANWLT